jgi:hypothetical protein
MLLYQSGHAEAADQAFPPPVDNGPSAMWLVLNYANYHGATKRAAQGETLLAEYMAGHPGLSANEQGNILMSLGSLARMAGNSKRADEYQLEGSQKLQPKDPPADVTLIGPVLQKAQSDASNRARDTSDRAIRECAGPRGAGTNGARTGKGDQHQSSGAGG